MVTHLTTNPATITSSAMAITYLGTSNIAPASFRLVPNVLPASPIRTRLCPAVGETTIYTQAL